MLRRIIIAGLLTVGLASIPPYRHVASGNAFPITVAGSPDRPGAILGLTVRLDGGPRTVGETLESFGFGDGVGPSRFVWPGRLVPRLGPDENSAMASAAANAWLAAHRVLGDELDYRSVMVVAEIERGSAAEASGVEEGELLPGQVREELEGATMIQVNKPTTPWPQLMVPPKSWGRSVGLASALAYLDYLTPTGITKGLTIAATGVIEPSGWVEGVSNTDFKARAAMAAGADVFFVPIKNLADACSVASGEMEVVAVRRLTDVLAWLDGDRSFETCGS